jgi:YVTN family beta-propeller protein
MKKRGIALVAALALTGGAGVGFGGYHWSVAHVRRRTERADLGFVSCDYCHLVRTERLPWAKDRPHHAAPAGLAVSPDGKRLFIALDDQDEIVEADAVSLVTLRRIKVSGGPFGLALDARGERLYVTCRREDRVAAIDTRDFRERESVAVGLLPAGIAWCQTPAGERLVVANSGSDDSSVLSLHPLAEWNRPAAGREPYAVAVAGDARRVFVANRLAVQGRLQGVPAAEITVLNPATGWVIERQCLDSAHLSEGIAPVPGRGWMLATLVKVRNLVPITQAADGWVMSSGLALSDAKGRITQIPLDEANDYFADPSGIAVDTAGARAYVASGGGDAISVVDLGRLAAWLGQAEDQTRQEAIEDLSLAPEYVVARIPTERNPRAVALRPDGKRLFVAERLNDTVLVVDTTTLKPAGRIVLGNGGLADPIRRGERVFTQARHTFQRQFSCRSCHPDGHVDGLAYDFDGDGIGDNLLDNRSLQGLAGTQPFKWNGKNPTLQVQCGPRFARVLMRTDPIPPADLDDLATFLKSLPPARTVPFSQLGKPLTPAQERGRQLFFATERPDGMPLPRGRQCQTCHRPPLFTNRLPSRVGTQGRRDSTDQFDTPHLLGIAASAPYLHDGRAQTLEELWTTYQTNDLHGVSSYWSKQMLNDLVEYLKTL